MGRPSVDALAMAGADWARYCVADDGGEEEEDAPPPEHLHAFEAFLETVVPVDMALEFRREEAARARRGEGWRGRREDVEEKLKLWAKAVAREAKAGVLIGSKLQATSRRLPHAREQVILARPGEANSLARGSKERGAQTSPGQARVGNHDKLAVHPNPLLIPSPRSGRRDEPWQRNNQPRPKKDIECIYGA